MQKPMYTIFDRVSRTYWTPFCAHNDEDAKRCLSNVVNVPSENPNDIYLHPEDFDLFHIGTFDDSADSPSIIQSLCPIEFVTRLDSLVQSGEK